jgi:hypothetical protein
MATMSKQSVELLNNAVADELTAAHQYTQQFDRQVDHINRFGERYLALQSFEGQLEESE